MSTICTLSALVKSYKVLSNLLATNKINLDLFKRAVDCLYIMCRLFFLYTPPLNLAQK